MSLQDWLKTQLRSSRSRILTDPYYRLRSLEEVHLAVQLGVRIDANQACVDDWLRLPGISIHQAQSLVALRRSGVQFHCLEDIAAALSVPVQRLRPLEGILQFCYYDHDSLCTIQPLNPNTASIEMLARIPGVDLFLARTIVEHRQRYGAYRSLVDLQQRLELPAPLTAELMYYLEF